MKGICHIFWKELVKIIKLAQLNVFIFWYFNYFLDNEIRGSNNQTYPKGQYGILSPTSQVRETAIDKF